MNLQHHNWHGPYKTQWCHVYIYSHFRVHYVLHVSEENVPTLPEVFAKWCDNTIPVAEKETYKGRSDYRRSGGPLSLS